MAQFETIALQRRHPEGLQVPKDLARIGTNAGRCGVSASRQILHGLKAVQDDALVGGEIKVVSQFEFASHARTAAPANIKQPKEKLIHLGILIFCCLCSIESVARDGGGFSGTLK